MKEHCLSLEFSLKRLLPFKTTELNNWHEMQMSILPAELQKISNCPLHSRPTLELNLMHANLVRNINY